jgi:hypothetical protein
MAADKNAPQDASTGVIQTYNADPSVQLGMLVGLKPKVVGTVIPVSEKESRNLLGVVVPAEDAVIALTPQSVTSQQVFVAKKGQYNVLVSTQNGPIKAGDSISPSALKGIGMKAGSKQAVIIGEAVGDFKGTTSLAGSVKLKDELNREKAVSVGRVAVDLNIMANPNFEQATDYFIPAFIQRTASSLAGQPVSGIKIYLGIALLAITGFIATSVLYSGIRGGMIAVGRNPLSKKSIIRSLIQAVFAGLFIFVAGAFTVYLLLKL